MTTSDHIQAAVNALDVEFPDWFELEFASQLDDWAARGPLKRVGVRTLGDLVDALLAGKGWQAISFFESLQRHFASSPRLCTLVLSLFGHAPKFGPVVVADVRWSFREVFFPLVCPSCGADPREVGVITSGYDRTWRESTFEGETLVVDDSEAGRLADGIMPFIPTTIYCGQCCEPIIEGCEDGREDV